MRFHLLGALEVVADDGELTPTAPKLRQVLALLLLRHNRMVQTGELVEELWGSTPPSSFKATLQTYVYKLRQIGARNDRPGRLDQMLRTRPNGYLITVRPDDLDLHQFEWRVEEGQAALEANDPARAAAELAKALSLWRGPALADVTAGSVILAHLTSLEESRLRALELKVEAELRLGRHRSLIGELKELVGTHPLNETFHAQLMVALYRSGRRSEALEVYTRLRTILVSELGIEPSTTARNLHQSMLSSDPGPALTTFSPDETTSGRIGSRASSPAQLPPDLADFTGHGVALSTVRATLAGAESAVAPPVVLVTGMPGVGKTAFAVHAARMVRGAFDGGQFFFDLRGSTGSPARPADVLRSFLRASGLRGTEIPDSVEECAKSFRSWCSGRRVLVVLDDAGSVPQVSPLIPGDERCAVIITSRGGLYSLPGAVHVELPVLGVEDGVALLRWLAGAGRVDQEPQAAALIVRLCGGLPLAVRAAGARLVARRLWRLAELVDQLVPPGRRLRELDYAGFDIRGRVASGYRALDAGERSAVCALAGLLGRRFTACEAAEALGCDRETADALLFRLVETYFARVVAAERPNRTEYELNELPTIYALDGVQSVDPIVRELPSVSGAMQLS